MPELADHREVLVRYLLGVASVVEREAVEEEYFAGSSGLDVLLAVEDELIDDYVRGALSRADRLLFEENFLCTAGRRQRLEFTQSLVEVLAGPAFGDLSASDHEFPSRFSAVTGSFQDEAKTGAFFGTPQGQPALDDPQELFFRLLEWLDPVRERAAEKFETIRGRLIQMFASRGRFDAEKLADQTIDWVFLRFAQRKQTYVGDPASYFYGVARLVLLESQRASERMMPDAVPGIEAARGDKERAHSCLQKCLEQLSDRNRELIMQYYSLEKKPETGAHKELAQRLGIPLSTLRARAFRIRTSLQKCVRSCVEAAND
jgi:DNA-directed RNA polymerase specialized sigma24 family protein